MKSKYQYILAIALICLRIVSHIFDIKFIQPIDDVLLALSAVFFTTAITESSNEKINTSKFNFYYNLIGSEISMSKQRIDQLFETIHEFKKSGTLVVLDGIPPITQFPPEIFTSRKIIRNWFYTEIVEISSLNTNISGMNIWYSSFSSEVSQLENMTNEEQAGPVASYIRNRCNASSDKMLANETEIKEMAIQLFEKHKELMPNNRCN